MFSFGPAHSQSQSEPYPEHDNFRLQYVHCFTCMRCSICFAVIFAHCIIRHDQIITVEVSPLCVNFFIGACLRIFERLPFALGVGTCFCQSSSMSSGQIFLALGLDQGHDGYRLQYAEQSIVTKSFRDSMVPKRSMFGIVPIAFLFQSVFCNSQPNHYSRCQSLLSALPFFFFFFFFLNCMCVSVPCGYWNLEVAVYKFFSSTQIFQL